MFDDEKATNTVNCSFLYIKYDITLRLFKSQLEPPQMIFKKNIEVFLPYNSHGDFLLQKLYVSNYNL